MDMQFGIKLVTHFNEQCNVVVYTKASVHAKTNFDGIGDIDVLLFIMFLKQVSVFSRHFWAAVMAWARRMQRRSRL